MRGRGRGQEPDGGRTPRNWPSQRGKDPTSEKEELAFTAVQKIANLQIHLQAGDEHGG